MCSASRDILSALRSHGHLCAIVETLPRLEAIRKYLHCPVAPSSRCLGVTRMAVPQRRISRNSEQFRTYSQSEWPYILHSLFRLAPFNHQKLNTLRTSSQQYPALHTLHDIEMISQVLEQSIRFLTLSKLLKSVYKRNSYEQKKRFRDVLLRKLSGKRQASSLAPLDP